MMSEFENYLSESEEIWFAFSYKYGDLFSHDGILNPKTYFESGMLKIMFLLNENYNEGGWSIIDKIDNTSVLYKSPYNGSRVWAPNILRTLFYTRDELWVRSFENYKIQGTGFAYLNIKKKDEGKTRSSVKDIDYYAKTDKDLLNRQIIACSPDIVFCAAKDNYRRLKMILDVEHESTVSNAHIMTYKTKSGLKKLLGIEWFHPSRNIKGWSIDNCKKRIDEFRPWIKRYSLY